MKNDMSRRFHVRIITNVVYSIVISCLVVVFLITNLTMIGEYAVENGKDGTLVSVFYQPDTVIVILYVLIGIGIFATVFLLLQEIGRAHV